MSNNQLQIDSLRHDYNPDDLSYYDDWPNLFEQPGYHPDAFVVNQADPSFDHSIEDYDPYEVQYVREFDESIKTIEPNMTVYLNAQDALYEENGIDIIYGQKLPQQLVDNVEFFKRFVVTYDDNQCVQDVQQVL